MKDNGITPDVTSYNYMLTVLCVAGDLEATTGVLSLEEGLEVDPRTYDAMVLRASFLKSVLGPGIPAWWLHWHSSFLVSSFRGTDPPSMSYSSRVIQLTHGRHMPPHAVKNAKLLVDATISIEQPFVQPHHQGGFTISLLKDLSHVRSLALSSWCFQRCCPNVKILKLEMDEPRHLDWELVDTEEIERVCLASRKKTSGNHIWSLVSLSAPSRK
uniref:Pentatricopeptide repeat-containing protein n=1 Tax=Nelumbo nucifera TaxID=4432 RepID=A0A822XNI7_NELNU|nr:TPA_asm: hypothetical protein HUJ06_024637 [Nelumbo nucifera]